MCLSYERGLIPILTPLLSFAVMFSRMLLDATIQIMHHIFANYVKMFGVNSVKISVPDYKIRWKRHS
jgi:hypothetical protein